MSDKRDVVLEACDLRHQYGDKAVLRGLNFKVAAGEIYALLGGNGAGKSTTLSAFLGLIRPTGGTVRVMDQDVTEAPDVARAKIAYVPENVALYEHLTARENLSYFLALAGADASASRIEAALEAAGLAPDARGRRVGGFSKGMRQKTAIGLAIARHAPVLLLDEPTSGLDPRAAADFNRLLDAARSRGMGILMVTHDLLGAAEIADRIGFLADGRLEAELTAEGEARFDVWALHARYVRIGQTDAAA